MLIYVARICVGMDRVYNAYGPLMKDDARVWYSIAHICAPNGILVLMGVLWS
jgi:hypothetical protein